MNLRTTLTESRIVRITFVFLLVLFCNRTVVAQNGVARAISDFNSIAEQYIQSAQELFNNGDYDSCIAVLNNGLKVNMFDRKGNEDMLCLKTKAYLEKDDLKDAEKTMKQLLEYNPHYELIESQNTEDFNRLFKQFDVHAKLIFGIRNTLMFPALKTTAIYSAVPGYNYTAPYTTAKYFLMYYGWAEYQFRDNISINLEGVYWSLSYSRNMALTTNTTLNMNEQMHIYEIPVFARFYMPHNMNIPFLKNILPYAAFGIGYLHLKDATANLNEYVINPNTGYLTSNSYANGVNMMNMRAVNTFEWVYGLGIGYKIKNLRLYLDWRAYAAMNTLTDASKRMNNVDLYNYYSYVDNGIKLNKSEIGASISYTLKNSVKKKPIKKTHTTVQGAYKVNK
jgi:hypothetical protein